MTRRDTHNEQRRDFLKAAAGLGIVVPIAGCGSPDDPDDGSDPNGMGDDDSDDPFAGDLREMVLMGAGEIGTIDPAEHQIIQTTVQSINFYDPLVWIDPDDFSVMENVATDWDVEDGGTRWTFELRDDIEFHSGNQLTAEDVAYSMDRQLELSTGYASLWGDFLDPGDTEVVDEYTVEFNLNSPFGIFLESLVRLMIVDSEVVQDNEEGGDFGNEFLSRDEAGSGPYTLNEWDQPNNEIVWDAFDGYWKGWNDNHFERVTWKFVAEVSTIISMMQSGQAHMDHMFLSNDAKETMAESDVVEVVQEPAADLFHMPMHTRKEPLDDPKVREAITYAFDHQTAVEDILQAEPARGPVPPSLPGHNDTIEPFEQDMDRAMAALDDADYSVDEINEIGIELSYDPGVPTNEQIGLLLNQNLEQLGIEELSLSPEQYPALVDRLSSEDSSPAMYTTFNPPTIGSPYDFLNSVYHPSAFGTFRGGSWYAPDDVVDLLESAAGAATPEEADEYFADAQELIVEGFPSVYVAQNPITYAMNTRIGGWTFRSLMGFDVYPNDMYLQE